MVLDPDVGTDPLTVITYPDAALVEAAIWDVAVAVSVGENNWLKVTAPEVAVEQSGIPAVVLTVAPVQKIRDSGIVPVRTIAVEVLTATEPASNAVVQAASLYVVIRRKNVELVVLGLVTDEKLTV
jgi:hypothetical protein